MSAAIESERTIAGERSHPDRMPERTMTSDRSHAEMKESLEPSVAIIAERTKLTERSQTTPSVGGQKLSSTAD